VYIQKLRVFEWDPLKALANFEKHKVSFEEAASVFLDPDSTEADDLEHSLHEYRAKRLGKSALGRILLVIFTVRRFRNDEEKTRIISARQANRKERKVHARLRAELRRHS
jgi:uncharacterized DUF497 family protein